MRTICVTGGTGYVGSRLVRALRERGHRVIAIDSVPPEERDITFPSDVQFRRADLRSPAEAERALRGADLVVHLAADIGSLQYMHEHQADIITNNAAIDAALYPALVSNRIPHIVYSSTSMAFQHPPRFPYRESDLADIKLPTNIYGFSKLIGEYFCRAHTAQHGITHTIVRFHNIYGPGEDSKGATPGDIHVIPALLEKVIGGQYPLELLGESPEIATRPFVFVDDAVEATVMIIEKALANETAVRNEDFNIGNDHHYTILELGEIIWKNYGDARPFKYIVVPTKAHTALRREVDISKIKEKIGWQPKTALEDGLAPTAAWIKSRKK